METVETLECRIYMTEEELYTAARALNALLHDVNETVGELRGHVDELVSRSGRVRVETKAREVIARIRSFEANLDLGALERAADEVARIEERIRGYEREIEAQSHGARLASVA